MTQNLPQRGMARRRYAVGPQWVIEREAALLTHWSSSTVDNVRQIGDEIGRVAGGSWLSHEPEPALPDDRPLDEGPGNRGDADCRRSS